MNSNHAHWTMVISDYMQTWNGKPFIIARPYFDGTRAQALKHFRRHKYFKQYANRDGCLITIESHDVMVDNRVNGRDY